MPLAALFLLDDPDISSRYFSPATPSTHPRQLGGALPAPLLSPRDHPFLTKSHEQTHYWWQPPDDDEGRGPQVS